MQPLLLFGESMRFLLLPLCIVPLVELALLIKAAGYIGIFPTVGLVLLTAASGLYLLRHQGADTFARAREELACGRLPAVELLEGVIIAVCGALLLAPGFISDTLALMALTPALRRPLAARILKRTFLSDSQGWFGRRRSACATDVHNDHEKHGREVEGQYYRKK